MRTSQSSSHVATIGDVSRDTGLSKDTLRVWERRYGFPAPVRNSNEERLYPSEQVQRLRVIRRLMDSGARPGKIVGLTLDQLIELGAPRADTSGAISEIADATHRILELLKTHRAEAVHQLLVQLLMQLGLRQFILEVVVPLNGLVGNAWLTGSLEIFEEHLYTHQVQVILQHALGAMPPSQMAPRVLLTTLPGEEHSIGVLMAHAFFAIDGAQCISLGAQTPPADIVRAANAFKVDIVGVSCSGAVMPRLVNAQLSLLRDSLERQTKLWVGGSSLPPARYQVRGARYVEDLREIPNALALWRTECQASDCR